MVSYICPTPTLQKKGEEGMYSKSETFLFGTNHDVLQLRVLNCEFLIQSKFVPQKMKKQKYRMITNDSIW